MPAPRRRIVLTAVAVVAVVLIGLVVRARTSGGGGQAARSPDKSTRPVAVTLAKVDKRDVPVWLEGLGTVAAWQQVTVRAQVDGRLDKVYFTEGQFVHKGDLLAQIDPRPFAAQLHQAEGALARDRAQLHDAQINLERYRDLRAGKLIAQQQVDDQAALAGQAEGAVHGDEAQIETATLNLDYAHVRSPLDGVVGVRQIDAGNLVHATDPNGLVVITELDPAALFVTLPEDVLPEVTAAMARGQVPVEAWSRDGLTKLGQGVLFVIDNQINAATATLRLKCKLPNPQRKLWPNQFVKARLLVETRKGATVVAAAAVQRGPSGTFVYVAGPDGKAEQRPVEIGLTLGELAIVDKGVEPGETIVVEGQNQLRPGSVLQSRGRRSEHLRAVHPAAGRHDSINDRRGAGGPARLSRAARGRAAAGRLSDHRRRHQPAGGQRRDHGVGGDDAAGAAVRADAFVDADDLGVVVRDLAGDAAVRARPQHRRRRAGRAGGDQRRVEPVAADAAVAADLLEVEPRRHAGADASRSAPTRCRSREVDDYADSVLAQKISQVSGVGLVSLNGGQKPAVRVQVDPLALAGAGLSLEDVRLALAAANVNQPKGNVDGPRQDFTIATNDQIDKAAGFRPLVIAYKNGAPVRLAEVANVVDGVENQQLAGWASQPDPARPGEKRSKRAVIVNVQRQPGANIIEVTDHIKKLLPQLAASMPQGIDVSILSDRTETVRASVSDVQFTLVLTVLLVVLVIYVFLRSFRATIIPGVAVPLSLIATFGVMHLCGFSLNNLSLMALTISTGFVVDDAIVMVENIARYVEAGERPFEAALKGAKQIGFTIVSLTVSLIAVLIPLLFMGGLIGRLFREFAVTLAIAIGVSALLSLTLTAMMAGWLLKPHAEEHPGRFARWFEGGLHRRPRACTSAPSAGCCATGWRRSWPRSRRWRSPRCWPSSCPRASSPSRTPGSSSACRRPLPTSRSPRMMERQQALAQVILRDPDVAAVASFIGADGTNVTSNSGRFSITLRPRDARTASATEIIARLQPAVAKVDGVTLYLQAVQDLQIDNRLSRTQYQYTVEDADAAELTEWAPKILAKLKTLPVLSEVASDQATGGLQLALTIDRDTAGRLGVTPQAIDDTLYDAFGQRIVSTIFTQLNLYRVILEVRPEDQLSPDALSRIFVRSATGDAVPLSSFARYQTRRAPLSIGHQGQFPSVTLSFNTARRESLGAAVQAIEQAVAEIDPPPSIHGEFQGAAAAFRDSLASEPLLLLAALLTVYIVLGVLYESYIHPLTILSTLPSAGVGALLALILCKAQFDVIALIGVILLVGIVKKNAIMMIDFALEAERDKGMTPEESIFQACLLRFRPIMMTTMAALLGALPLALGSGTGSELRRPLGITIVGGLLLSQILTLYTTPVIYLYMERVGRAVRRKGAPAAAPPPMADA